MPVGIEQFGDSTTASLIYINGGYTASPVTAPDQLYLDANAKWPGQVIVYNRGISGSIAMDLLNGSPSFENKMASSTAHIVTFNFGINEASDARRQTGQQYAACLDALVKIAKKYGKKVVLLQPNTTDNPAIVNLGAYSKAMDAIGKANQVMVVPHFDIWTATNYAAVYLGDGIHPTKDGYVFKGHTEFQYLYPLIAQYLGA